MKKHGSLLLITVLFLAACASPVTTVHQGAARQLIAPVEGGLITPEPAPQLAAQPSVPNFAYQFDAGYVKVRTVNVTTGQWGPIVQNVYVPWNNGGVVSPNGKFAYALSNNAPSAVYEFSIDSSTGFLTAAGSVNLSATSRTSPIKALIDPSGRFLYVLNAYSGQYSVSAFTIDAVSGALTAVSGSPFALPTSPRDIVIDPAGKFLYVSISVYAPTVNLLSFTINPSSGALAAGTPVSTATSNTFAAALAIDPTGAHLYASEDGLTKTKVDVYNINPATGNLSPLAASPFTVGGAGNPSSLVLDNTGNYLYLGRQNTSGSPNLLAFGVNVATGELTGALPGSPYTAFSSGYSSLVTLDPSGKFLYLGSAFASDGVDGFSINSANGQLTHISGLPVSGLNTSAIGFTKKVIIPNFGYEFEAGYVNVRSVDPTTGQLGLTIQSSYVPWNIGGVVTPNGKFAYALSNDAPSAVYAFAVNSTSGMLTAAGSFNLNATLRTAPIKATTDPSGKFLYVLNAVFGQYSVSAFSIDATTGALTPAPGSPYALPEGPRDFVIDPAGRYLYVSISVYAPSANILSFTIDPTSGSLTAGAPVSTALANTFAAALTIDPTSNHLYAAEDGYTKTNVDVYTINATTGNLTALTGSPFAVGGAGNPSSLVVDNSGKYLYIGRQNTGPYPNLLGFGLNASTGALTGSLPGSPYMAFASGYTSELSVDPSGKFLYVCSDFASDGVDGFSISAADGGLSHILGLPLAGLNTDALSITSKIQ